MLINSNRELAEQESSADSSINNSLKNGKSGSALTPLEIPITGYEASRLMVQRLGHQEGEHFWLKVNNLYPHKVEIREGYELYVTRYQKRKKQDENGRWIKEKNGKYLNIKDKDGDDIWFADAATHHWQELIPALSHEKDSCENGIFIIPNKLGNGIRAKNWEWSQTIFFEIDNISFEKQWRKIDQFYQATGLMPCLVVNSGGKSLHVYYALSERLSDNKTRLELQRYFAILFNADTTITNANREMRMAGCYRFNKDKEQVIEFTSECQYTVAQIKEAFKTTFPHGISDLHWKGYLNFKQKKLTPFNLKEFFYKSEEQLTPKKIPIRRDNVDLKNITAIPLIEFVGLETRRLIEGGITQGQEGRNPTALKIASQLRGKMLVLDRLGINYIDDAYELVETFCANCNPSISHECDRIWNNSSGVGELTEINDDWYLSKASWWLKKNNPEEYRRIYKDDSLDPAEQELKGQKLSTEEWVKEKTTKQQLNCRNSKNLTPTERINQEWFSYWQKTQSIQLSLFGAVPKILPQIHLPPENLHFFGCADLGGGKSTFQKLVIETIRRECPTERWFFLGYRNGLLLQQCTSWGAKHLQSNKAFGEIRNEKQDLALCIHSLQHFEGYLEAFDGCNIVIDEVVSVIKSLLQDDLIRNRDLIFNLFFEAIRRAKRVFYYDANLCDWVIEYITRNCPAKQVITIKNDFKKPKPKIEFLLGSIVPGKEEIIKEGDNSPIIKALINSPRFVLVCDNKTQVQILSEILKKQGKAVLTVCSETHAQEDVKAFLQNADQWIYNNWISKGIDGCVLLSPTGESGLDISVKNYFTDVYGLFFGIIDVDSVIQLIGRVRDDKAKFHIWCKPKGQIQNLLADWVFPKQIQREVRDYIENSLKNIIWEGWEGNPLLEVIHGLVDKLLIKANDIHFEFESKLFSIQLYEEWNFKECLIEALESKGYHLNFVSLESDENSKNKIKGQREELDSLLAKEIYEARDIEEKEQIEISSKFFQTHEEKILLKRYSLRSRLPGIDQTDIWNEDFIKLVLCKDTRFVSQCELLYLFQNPEIAKLRAQQRWAAALKNENLRHFELLGERYAKIRVFQEMNLEWFLTPGNTWGSSTPELIDAAKIAKKKANATALGKAPGKDLVKWINGILASLSLEVKSQSQRGTNERERTYEIIHTDSLKTWRETVLNCLKNRLNPQEISQKINSHFSESKIAPTPCYISDWSRTLSPNFSYKENGNKCALDNEENLTVISNSKHLELIPPLDSKQRRATDVLGYGCLGGICGGGVSQPGVENRDRTSLVVLLPQILLT